MNDSCYTRTVASVRRDSNDKTLAVPLFHIARIQSYRRRRESVVPGA